MLPVARAMVDFRARSILDEDGRPVAEVASPLYADTPTELVACPYADRRRGMPMNASALRQLAGVWPDVLGAFSTLAGPSPTVHRAWAAALTGVALPSAIPAPVPRRVSSLFKASLGLSQIFSHLLLAQDGVADVPLGALGDDAAFFAALDTGGWLIGAEQACAGTSSMICQAFRALVRESPSSDAVDLFGYGEAEWDGLRAQATVAVGLQVVQLAAAQRAARLGVGTPPPPVSAPWLRVVFAAPNRPPHDVRRLFPGALPAPVQRLLELVDASPTERGRHDRLFEQEIIRLDATSR